MIVLTLFSLPKLLKINVQNRVVFLNALVIIQLKHRLRFWPTLVNKYLTAISSDVFHFILLTSSVCIYFQNTTADQTEAQKLLILKRAAFFRGYLSGQCSLLSNIGVLSMVTFAIVANLFCVQNSPVSKHGMLCYSNWTTRDSVAFRCGEYLIRAF